MKVVIISDLHGNYYDALQALRKSYDELWPGGTDRQI